MSLDDPCVQLLREIRDEIRGMRHDTQASVVDQRRCNDVQRERAATAATAQGYLGSVAADLRESMEQLAVVSAEIRALLDGPGRRG